MQLLLTGTFTFLSLTFLAFPAIGQKAKADSTGPHTVADVLTADSLASGNTRDVLTSFFQLAFNRLTTPNKELDFTSNPFALMLKSDTTLAVDTNYAKYRALRKTNFGFGLKLDSSYRFNGFSSGVTYALVNKRDSSTSKKLFYLMRHNAGYQEVDSFQAKLAAYNKTITDFNLKKQFSLALDAFVRLDTPFNKLDTGFQRVAKEIATANKAAFPDILDIIDKKPSSNLAQFKTGIQKQLNNRIRNDWLWTVSVSDTTYKDQFFFSNLVFGTELLKGLFTPDSIKQAGSNVELDVKAGLNLIDDSLLKGRNLQRGLLYFAPGVNFVVRNKSNRQSWLEFLFSGSYSRNVTTLYPNEHRDSLTFNATIRVRVINNVWIPLEIMYDPRSGNVFGFLNVRLDFSTLSGLTNSSKSAAKKND